MASTPLLGLALPADGVTNWGTLVNTSITALLDSAVSGTTTISSASPTYTLTTTNEAPNEARQAVILCTGATTGVQTIIAPAQSKTYVVINATANNFGVKIVGVGPTTGVTVPKGRAYMVAWNGSDFVVTGLTTVDLAADVTGILPIANGGTGANTAAGARTGLGATTVGGNMFTLTNPTAVTFPRFNADNTVSALSDANFRTAIGSTTVGGNMFTLTNPSAITFPRFNADNTVSALNAADFRTAIGAGTGSGTVTSVTGTSPVASSGGATPAISLAAGYGDSLNPYASKTANTFLAAPNGAAGVPTFRAFVSADLSETLTVAKGGTGLTTYTANGVLYASGTGTLANGTGLTFASGNLGVGVAAAFYKLEVETTSGGVTPYIASFNNSSTSTTQANIIRITQAASGAATGYIGTGGSAYSDTSFRNNFVVGTLGANSLVFNTVGVERARIDTSGNLQMQAGAAMQYQPSHVSINSAVTLSNADIQARIIITSGTSYTIRMPSGSTLNTLVPWAADNIGYDFCVINNASGTISIDTNAGVTILGSVFISAGVSAQFRIGRGAAGVYTVYRLS